MNKLQLRGIMLLIVLVVCCNAATAQSYVDKMLSHQITVHYPDHTVVATVKPTGTVQMHSEATYHWFTGTQINSTQGGYSGKLLNGTYHDFYLHKNLKEAGVFKNGLKTGLWKSWSEDGVLKDEFTYNDGLRNGAYLKYDAVGKVNELGTYHHNLLNGKQTTITGDSAVVVYYDQGKIKEQKKWALKFIQKLLPKQRTHTGRNSQTTAPVNITPSETRLNTIQQP